MSDGDNYWSSGAGHAKLSTDIDHKRIYKLCLHDIVSQQLQA